jgi:hypothetical protein
VYREKPDPRLDVEKRSSSLLVERASKPELAPRLDLGEDQESTPDGGSTGEQESSHAKVELAGGAGGLRAGSGTGSSSGVRGGRPGGRGPGTGRCSRRGTRVSGGAGSRGGHGHGSGRDGGGRSGRRGTRLQGGLGDDGKVGSVDSVYKKEGAGMRVSTQRL